MASWIGEWSDIKSSETEALPELWVKIFKINFGRLRVIFIQSKTFRHVLWVWKSLYRSVIHSLWGDNRRKQLTHWPMIPIIVTGKERQTSTGQAEPRALLSILFPTASVSLSSNSFQVDRDFQLGVVVLTSLYLHAYHFDKMTSQNMKRHWWIKHGWISQGR